MITSEPEKVKRSKKKEKKEEFCQKRKKFSEGLGISVTKKAAEMNFSGLRTGGSAKGIKIYGNRVFFFS